MARMANGVGGVYITCLLVWGRLMGDPIQSPVEILNDGR